MVPVVLVGDTLPEGDCGKLVAEGRGILMSPGLWAFRNGSSWLVRGRTRRSFLLTIPATELTLGLAPDAFQSRATSRLRSKPSTASVKSLMKFRRRSSPSIEWIRVTKTNVHRQLLWK